MAAAPEGSPRFSRRAFAGSAPSRGWGFAPRAARLVLANLVAFAVYRLLFLGAFAPHAGSGRVAEVLWRGLRLDAALLSLEAGLLCLLALLTRRFRPPSFLAGLWLLTVLNLSAIAANLVFYSERRAHLWEMLLANLDRASQIGVAIEPFLRLHPWIPAAVAAALFVAWRLARRDVRAVAGPSRDLWRDRRAQLAFAAVVVVGIAVSFEAAPTKRGERNVKYRLAASKHFMSFPEHALNQAVVNPVLDFLVYHVPAEVLRVGYRLGEDEALAGARRALDLPAADPRYPLLRTIAGEDSLGIRNVVWILVEGLGTSILEHRVDGEPAMPFLSSLAARGLFFPNAYQSFSATDGSVFAVTTGLHRGFNAHAVKSYFFPYEYEGHFGSLPRLLEGRGYRHFFFAGFRQRIEEFVSFASNQGYEAVGYEELVERLGERAEESGNALGIFDDALLEEAATSVLAAGGPFTLQVMTGTSHSPWTVPSFFDAAGLPPELAAFRYADWSLHRFVERLRRELPDFAATLFVVSGDHTSITLRETGGERFRVPLVLYSAALDAQRERWVARQTMRASHVDILPTTLGRLSGEHRFAGMGRDLLGEDADGERGLVSSSHHESLYLKGDYALRYEPRSDSARLSRVDGEDIGEVDVSSDYPEIVDELRREYLALYETADRLARSGRVFPRETHSGSRLVQNPR